MWHRAARRGRITQVELAEAERRPERGPKATTSAWKSGRPRSSAAATPLASSGRCAVVLRQATARTAPAEPSHQVQYEVGYAVVYRAVTKGALPWRIPSTTARRAPGR